MRLDKGLALSGYKVNSTVPTGTGLYFKRRRSGMDCFCSSGVEVKWTAIIHSASKLNGQYCTEGQLILSRVRLSEIVQHGDSSIMRGEWSGAEYRSSFSRV